MLGINAELPVKLDFLREKKARYKVPYGGRGSAKSWSIARALLIKGVQNPIRWLCTRELQKSIKDSVLSIYISALIINVTE